MKAKLILCSMLVLGFTAGCGDSTKDLLSNPKDSDVKSAITSIEGVKNICMVTEENDPNGNLNKAGSYTGAVYFRLTQVDEQLAKDEYSTPLGDDACEIGTKGGGQIEIYENEKDAEKRNTYLANFDGTPLGDSHVLKGTVIIRLSNDLMNSQQKDLEEKIIEVLSKERE